MSDNNYQIDYLLNTYLKNRDKNLKNNYYQTVYLYNMKNITFFIFFQPLLRINY